MQCRSVEQRSTSGECRTGLLWRTGALIHKRGGRAVCCDGRWAARELRPQGQVAFPCLAPDGAFMYVCGRVCGMLALLDIVGCSGVRTRPSQYTCARLASQSFLLVIWSGLYG